MSLGCIVIESCYWCGSAEIFFSLIILLLFCECMAEMQMTCSFDMLTQQRLCWLCWFSTQNVFLAPIEFIFCPRRYHWGYCGLLPVESLVIKAVACQNFKLTYFLQNLPYAIIISHIMLDWSIFMFISPMFTALKFLGSRNAALPTEWLIYIVWSAHAIWI